MQRFWTGSGRSRTALDPNLYIRDSGVCVFSDVTARVSRVDRKASHALLSPPLDKVKTSSEMLDLDGCTRQTSPSPFIQKLSTVIGGSAGSGLFWGPGQRMLHSNDHRPWVPEVFITGWIAFLASLAQSQPGWQMKSQAEKKWGTLLSLTTVAFNLTSSLFRITLRDADSSAGTGYRCLRLLLLSFGNLIGGRARQHVGAPRVPHRTLGNDPQPIRFKNVWWIALKQ